MIWNLLPAILPLAFWWRFRNTPLDRDYAPYCYPAVFKVGYLQGGHFDIKPPLIHWGYKAWQKLLSLFSVIPMSKSQIRFLSSALISASPLAAAAFITTPLFQIALITAFLLSNPYLWAHMANTEWMTSLLLMVVAAAMPNHPLIAAVALGLLPLVNLKNLPVVALVGILLVPESFTAKTILAFISTPVMATLFLLFTRRLNKFWQACFATPWRFSKKRHFASNNMLLIRNAAIEIVPFVCCMDWSNRWAWVFVGVCLLTIAAIQITPHHFLLMAAPLAMACHPTPGMWLAVVVLWLLRHLKMWINPALIYDMTFSDPRTGVSYQRYLDDAKPVEDWIKANTSEGAEIWVEGVENQIYLNTNRRAAFLNVPEMKARPDGYPEYVVHCAASKIISEDDPFWKEYEFVLASHLGLYSLMRRKNRVILAKENQAFRGR